MKYLKLTEDGAIETNMEAKEVIASLFAMIIVEDSYAKEIAELYRNDRNRRICEKVLLMIADRKPTNQPLTR